MRLPALILCLILAPLASLAQGPEPRDAEYAMRWDPAEGGPKTAGEVFALLGMKAPAPERYEIRYFDLEHPAGTPESTTVILRERHESDGKIEIRLKYRRLAPWPESWSCPPDSPYERSEQVDVTLLGADQVQRVYSYACDLATENPPAALHATAKSCSDVMMRSDAGKVRAEEWMLPGGRRLLEVSHAANNTSAELARFREMASKIIARGAKPSALSKSTLGSGCPPPGAPDAHADTLRGSNGAARAWWDATFYDLHVTVHPADSTISGWNTIHYRVLKPPAGKRAVMQIDLQQPLVADSFVQDGRALTSRRDGNAFFVTLRTKQPKGAERSVTAYYHGMPRAAKNPPWDGGLIWRRDSLGNRWSATANQGLGASVWWPNKDYQADEPDSQRIAITVPDSMFDVSNGRLRNIVHHEHDGTTTYEWFVTQPINNYDVEINAGDYAHFSEVYWGERGPLTMDFWPLAYHVDTARVQWAQARSMMKCFEWWFGPYPWYEDGYKLVESPHLGMEHQSGTAYGNGFKNGYRGRDLSQTGWGTKWDFIIVHESAHEWWGNSITSKDLADEWVHESFANYSEALYTECLFGKTAGAEYQRGTRALIRNDRAIIGAYGVNQGGPLDTYYKGGNMLHTIRQVVNNDSTWRAVLRGLQSQFYHQTVTTAQIEHYMSAHNGVDLSKIFEQYLRTTMIPVLEYRADSISIAYRWANVVPGFAMPVQLTIDGAPARLTPTAAWQTMPLARGGVGTVVVDPDFYVTSKQVTP